MMISASVIDGYHRNGSCTNWRMIGLAGVVKDYRVGVSMK